jgi:hypothetical protein
MIRAVKSMEFILPISMYEDEKTESDWIPFYTLNLEKSTRLILEIGIHLLSVIIPNPFHGTQKSTHLL